MTDPGSRRNFLRGRFSSQPAALRPPWALAEDAFVSACTRCGDCATSCPTGIIVGRRGDFPVIDFGLGECTFCGDCTQRCTAEALLRSEATPPWSIRACIGDSCIARHGVECRVCGERCDSGAIRFRPRAGGFPLPELEDSRCTGCGSCLAPCPAQAIRIV